MPQVAELADEENYQKLQKDIRDQAVRAVRNGEDGMANHNIHRVKAIPDPNADEGEFAPVVAKVDTKLRPGSKEVEQPSIQYFSPDQLGDFDDHVLDDRVEWSASPFVDQLEIECERPEENVMATKDRWVFDPTVEGLFEGVIDLDALGRDISQANNIPKGDLNAGSQKGIEDVKRQKLDVQGNRESIIGAAREIIRPIVGPEADQVAFQTKTPMEIYHYVDDVVENADQIGEAKMKKLFRQLGNLHDAALQVGNDLDNTEESSIELFSEVLTHEGYSFPSTVSEPNDAIIEHGVGTLDYLQI